MLNWILRRIIARIEALENKMAELDDDIAAVQAEAANLSADETAVQAQIENLQAQIAGLAGAPTQGQLDSLKQAADNLAATHAAFVATLNPPPPAP